MIKSNRQLSKFLIALNYDYKISFSDNRFGYLHKKLLKSAKMGKDLLLEELSTIQKSYNPLTFNNTDEKNISIISKYNTFIRCYNAPCNRVDEKTLIFIPQSKIFDSFNSILIKRKFYILFLFFLLVPILNIFLLTYFICVTYRYFKGLKIYRKNQQRVKDPFINMKYDPQKCFQLKKNYYFMKIQFKSLRPQFNFKQNISLTSSQGKQGNKSEWMIYNQIFEAYYNDFPKWKVRIIIMMLTGVIETVAMLVIFTLILI